MVKRFLLDTNILLSHPESMINGFDDNHVIISGTTLQELDQKKSVGGELAYHARECLRILDSLREKGDIIKGIDLENGGKLFIEPDGVKQEYLPDGFSISSPDNRIISTCIHLSGKHDPVILVTNDISMRVNATACGIKVESYKNDQVEETGYTGHVEMESTSDTINELYKFKEIEIDKGACDSSGKLEENQFVTIKCGTQSALTVYQKEKLRLIEEQRLYGTVRPKNAMQSYAMWALSRPAEEIPLVIMTGVAGTAKTYLSLAAGLQDTYISKFSKRDGRYRKLLISRPTANSFKSVGFLPGSLDQKLEHLYQSFYDNLENILRGDGKDEEDPEQIKMHIDDMFETGAIEVCGLDFIRGRSLVDTYIICDEAQNASKSTIRDVITRAGEGTKVVLCGDPNQIDVPVLDKKNNGLVYAAEEMRGSKLAAIIHFSATHSVRSELAKEAITRLK